MRGPKLRPGNRGITIGLLLAVGLLDAGAKAEPLPVREAEQLSASPDTPVFELMWRRAPRVTVAGIIPLAGASAAATMGLRLTPFVELHNSPGYATPIPNENWRGRVSGEGWRLWLAGPSVEQAPWLRLGLGIEHESDHSTVRSDEPDPIDGFRMLNDLTLRATVGTATGGAFIATAELDSRFYALSCTQPGVDCMDALGSATYGGALELVLQRLLKSAPTWRAFWSVSWSWLVPSGNIIGEIRGVSHLGFRKQTMGGTWQFFVLGYLGNEVGVNRETSLQELGFGIRWSL